MTPKFKMFQAVRMTEKAIKDYNAEDMRGMVGIVQGIDAEMGEPMYIVRFSADLLPDEISELDLEPAND